MSSEHTQGGSREHQIRAGQQSRNNRVESTGAAKTPVRLQGGGHEQHVKAGLQNHKNSK